MLLHFYGSMFNMMLTVTYVCHQQQRNPLLHLPWWQQWLDESPATLHYTYVVHLVKNSWQIAARLVSIFLTDCRTLKLVIVFTAACCSSNWSQSTSSQPVLRSIKYSSPIFTYIFHLILWHQFLVYMFLNFMTISYSKF